MTAIRIAKSAMGERFWNAAQSILAYPTDPHTFSLPPESDFCPLYDLLKTQARNLIALHAEHPQIFIDKDQEHECPRDASNSGFSAGYNTMTPGSVDSALRHESSGDAVKTRSTDPGGHEPPSKLARLNDPPSTRTRFALLKSRIDMVVDFSYKKMYAYGYWRVPDYWICLYTDAHLMLGYYNLLGMLEASQKGGHEDVDDERLGQIIRNLDQALITTNGKSQALNGQEWIEGTMDLWYRLLKDEDPKKTLRLSNNTAMWFSVEEPFGRPTIKSPVPILEIFWTVPNFESYMLDTNVAPEPLVMPDLFTSWPAMTDRSWKSVDYLLSQTLGGRRQVPVEIGRSYVDEDWGQEIMSFKEFITEYILGTSSNRATGYLAQYELFRQIPQLKNDITILDYCWVDTPGHPLGESKDRPKLDSPNMNAWFGPAKTITPLHTDGYHNLLCQVVGTKYVRLYAPKHSDAMKPRGREDGIEMGNTSSLDVGVLAGWDERPEGMSEEELTELRSSLEDVEYFECILKPGDTLLIPMGWWHYVRSLSISFSVSFWWN